MENEKERAKERDRQIDISNDDKQNYPFSRLVLLLLSHTTIRNKIFLAINPSIKSTRI